MPNANWNGLLRTCQLEGIEFPVEHVEMRFSQDVVPHKYPNVPGANLESMSRNPITFHVRALFLQGLKGFANLFPETFQNVVRVLQDGLNEQIKFIHPTLGKFNVKVMGGSTLTTYASRNGQIIEFELMENGNNDASVTNNVLGNDLVAQTTTAAGNFDNSLGVYKGVNPTSITPTISASALVNNVLSAIGQTTQQIGTAVAQVENTVSLFQSTAQTLQALNDPSTSYMLIQLEAMTSGVNQVVWGSQNNVTRLIYTVKRPVTLANILKTLLQENPALTIENLLKLNPQLPISALLPVNTKVYYV